MIALLRALAALATLSFPAAAADPALSASSLGDDITKFVIEHPQAALKQVVDFANRREQEVGMNFQFDAQTDEKTVSLEAGGRQLSAEIGDEGACGERFVTVPALRVTASKIEMPGAGRPVVAQRPPSLRLDKMWVLTQDLKSVLAETEVPNQTWPHAVTTAGSVLLELPLGGGAGEWWARLQSKSKYFQGDTPYLLFEMVGGAPHFTDDERYYQPDSEPISNAPKDPKNAYATYLKFKSTHLVVRFSAPCT